MPKQKVITELVGACPVCGLQYFGRIHNCPGKIEVNEAVQLLGAQHLEKLKKERRRNYDERLEEGFEMLSDSGWGENY